MSLLKTWLPDVLLLAGAASISYGAWLAYEPLGFLAGGCFAVAAGRRLA